MKISSRIAELKNSLEEIADMLYKGEGKGIGRIKDELEDSISLINIFISAIPALEKMGIEVPREVIDEQIKNLQDGLSVKDFFLLADTLKYEICDTLSVIGDLVEGGIIKDEELF